ncbi:MAG: carbon storage regulator CsrA [Verrucomicrobia bacterium]|nr:carbon storage regulator CsrA [Verrucomicrobiota bacterium]
MLVLSRKTNESIVIDGKIFLNILRLEGDSVKVGVNAPKDVTVLRKEIYDEILESNKAAAAVPAKKDLQLILGNK